MLVFGLDNGNNAELNKRNNFEFFTELLLRITSSWRVGWRNEVTILEADLSTTEPGYSHPYYII